VLEQSPGVPLVLLEVLVELLVLLEVLLDVLLDVLVVPLELVDVMPPAPPVPSSSSSSELFFSALQPCVATTVPKKANATQVIGFNLINSLLVVPPPVNGPK
jgi:hypothetical protein